MSFGTAAAQAASTVSIVDNKCPSIVAGCLFKGNIAPGSFADAQAAFNLYNDTHAAAGADILLKYLFKSDDGAGFDGSITGKNTASGTWSTPGYAIDYIAVKAANQFVLFKLATPQSTGAWSTSLIPFNNNPHGLSHLTFFGTPADIGVPEPGTWAMMLIGFGFVGHAARQRRRQSVAA